LEDLRRAHDSIQAELASVFEGRQSAQLSLAAAQARIAELERELLERTRQSLQGPRTATPQKARAVLRVSTAQPLSNGK
jgi:hypothetical protein